MAPIAYVFTQTKPDKKEEVAKEIYNMHTKKIRVIDIVGALSNIEGINNEDIGVIEVQELCSYVDLLNNKGSKFLKKHREINIKKKLVKVRKDNKL